MQIKIKRLQSGDESIFARVAADVFDEAINAARLAAYLAEPGHFMIVALREDEVVGQVAAVIHRHPDKPAELYIDNLGVTPVLHRQGIARSLLDEIFALGKGLGCGEAWVGVEPDNRPARGFYESFGQSAEPFVMYVYEI